MAAVFLFGFNCVFSQTDDDVDELTRNICKTMESQNEVPDSSDLEFALAENFPAFMEKFKLNELSEELQNKIFYRLQKNCSAFIKIMFEKDAFLKGDWEMLTEKPKVLVSGEKCSDVFAKHHQFYYLEGDGSKTKVSINNGYWTDYFTDGTYSKLYFKDSGNCGFVITFIESNNMGRKNFSRKGDRYFYQITNINSNYLTLYTFLEEKKNEYHQFRLYFDDKNILAVNNFRRKSR